MENEAINVTNELIDEDDYAPFDWKNPGKQHDQNEEWWN